MKAKTTIDRQLFTVGFRRRINDGPRDHHIDIVASSFMDAVVNAERQLQLLGLDATITFVAKAKEAA